MRQAVARSRAVGPRPGRVDVRGKVGVSRAIQAALRDATDRSPAALAAVLAAVIAEGDPLRDLHRRPPRGGSGAVGPVEDPGRGGDGEVGDGHPGLGETQFRVGGQVPDQGDSGISGHDVLLRVWDLSVPR